ncbi:MAG: hypothetical protein R3181_15545, partial [Rubricoccaceae bacterium]|nr:hypothetical protein [Rubricoccaceae bacterium]
RFPMAAAFSLHWPEAEGRLDGTVTLEADWAYHTPVVGLSVEEVLQQVELLREQEIHRANTTGAPLFEPRGEPEQLAVRIEGPERAACGQPAEWTVRLWPGGGRYVTTYRYRVLDGEGRPGAWTTVYAPHLTLTPVPGQTGLELEAATQDLWAPHGTRTLENGWTAPHPDNHAASAQRTVGFDCGG